MSTTAVYGCSSLQGAIVTWFPCPKSDTTKGTTTTTTSPSSTTTTTTTQSTDTTSSSPSPTKPDGLPSDTSTGVKETSTAVPNPDSSVTSSLPASSQTATPLHQHTSLSTGATAGIAVGCAAAGLIIGLLAALLLFRRRKGKDVADISRATILVESKEPPSTENIDGIGPIAGIQLGQFLLDGASDQEIVSELQALSELIRQHVEDYYTLQPVDVSVGTLSQSLQNFGLGSSGLGLTAEAIVTICTNSYSRHIGLRYVISSVIFASIDFHTGSGLSMLPGPAAGFLQSIPGAEHGGNNNLGMQSLGIQCQDDANVVHSILSSSADMAPPVRFPPPPKPQPTNFFASGCVHDCTASSIGLQLSEQFLERLCYSWKKQPAGKPPPRGCDRMRKAWLCAFLPPGGLEVYS